MAFINDKKPEIVGLTETHITNKIEEQEIHIDNYVNVKMCTGNDRTGGVIIYIKEYIKFNKINKVMDYGNNESNMWICNVKL